MAFFESLVSKRVPSKFQKKQGFNRAAKFFLKENLESDFIQ